jgi:hypothetical protein
VLDRGEQRQPLARVLSQVAELLAAQTGALEVVLLAQPLTEAGAFLGPEEPDLDALEQAPAPLAARLQSSPNGAPLGEG